MRSPRSFTTFNLDVAIIRFCNPRLLPSRNVFFRIVFRNTPPTFCVVSRPRITAKKWQRVAVIEHRGYQWKPIRAVGRRRPSTATRNARGPPGGRMVTLRFSELAPKFADAPLVASLPGEFSANGTDENAMARSDRALRFAPFTVLSPGPRLAGMPSKGLEMSEKSLRFRLTVPVACYFTSPAAGSRPAIGHDENGGQHATDSGRNYQANDRK